MHKYKIVFSIPVHEKYEVVLDQCLNFLYFNEHCAIVLHISQGFDEVNSAISSFRFREIVNDIEGIYINDESVRTGLSDIIQAHISNYRYACKTIEFEYFSMCASNELFVKSGLYEQINKYDCGVEFFQYIERPSWEPAKYAVKDITLREILSDFESMDIMPSHIEGSFYSNKIFNEICNAIEKHYDYRMMTVKYPREEVYFPSVLYAMIQKNENIKIYPQLFTLVHWNIDRLVYNNMHIGLRDIRSCSKENNSFFTVKRIDRVLNDYRRVYIRRKTSYGQLLSHYVDLHEPNIIRIYINFFKAYVSLKYKHLLVFIKQGSYEIKYLEPSISEFI